MTIHTFKIPRTLSLSRLRDQLKLQFPLREDAPVRVTRHYLDSFDWRLYRAGYMLRADVSDDQVLLTLESLDGGEPLQLIARTVPVYAGDIASVALRRSVSVALGIRALIPQASLRIQRYPLRYVDGEEKTRLHVSLENVRLQPLNTSHGGRQLCKCVCLFAVKGYSRAQNEVSDWLVQEQSLEPSRTSMLEAALQAVDRSPADYSGQPDVLLEPDERTDVAFKRMLKLSLDVMIANEQGIVHDIDSEYLHDFRVAVRRTRALLSQIQGVYPKRIVKRFNDAFAWLGNVTGPVRDYHVYLLKFPEYRNALPVSIKPDLDALRDFLKRHQALEHRRMVHNLESKRYHSLIRSWREFLDAPVNENTTLAYASRPVRFTADVHIWQAYKKFIKRAHAISAECEDEKLHRLRISGKKLRYLMEFFHALYPTDKFSHLLREMKKIQDVLGDFQDLSVQTEALHGFEDSMQEEHCLNEATRNAMEQLVVQLQGRSRKQRQLFEKRFVLFSSPTMKSDFKRLFKPVEAGIDA